MSKPPRELIELLYPHDPAIQSLALGLRKVVLEEMTPCQEYIFAMGARVVLLYGTSERVIKDAVCMIVVYRKLANLGFRRGADLKNASGAIQGTGKSWRHISVRKLSDLDRPEIRACLRQARKLAGIKRTRRGADDVSTRVKRRTAKHPEWPDPFRR